MTTKVVPQLLDQSQGIGYTPGVGGTQTQQTSKSTAVTLNAPCGTITTHNEALAGGASVTFTLQNTFVTATDTMIVNKVWDAVDPTRYSIRAACGAGIAAITVTNVSGGSLSEAVAINFAVIKGVTS
jgi:hypothetical protein